MVENQYVIDISTNADPTSVEELSGKIKEATDNANELSNTTVTVNSEDASVKIAEIKAEIEGLEDEAELSFDDSELDRIADDIAYLQEELDELESKQVIIDADGTGLDDVA